MMILFPSSPGRILAGAFARTLSEKTDSGSVLSGRSLGSSSSHEDRCGGDSPHQADDCSDPLRTQSFACKFVSLYQDAAKRMLKEEVRLLALFSCQQDVLSKNHVVQCYCAEMPGGREARLLLELARGDLRDYLERRVEMGRKWEDTERYSTIVPGEGSPKRSPGRGFFGEGDDRAVTRTFGTLRGDAYAEATRRENNLGPQTYVDDENINQSFRPRTYGEQDDRAYLRGGGRSYCYDNDPRGGGDSYFGEDPDNYDEDPSWQDAKENSRDADRYAGAVNTFGYGSWGRGGGYTLLGASSSLNGGGGSFGHGTGMGTNGDRGPTYGTNGRVKRRRGKKYLSQMMSICEDRPSFLEVDDRRNNEQYHSYQELLPAHIDQRNNPRSSADIRPRSSEELYHDLGSSSRGSSGPSSPGFREHPCQHSQTGLLELREIADLLCQMLAALKYVHAKGVVHFDLKPDNFLCFFPPTENSFVNPNIKLADFGISAQVATDRTYVAAARPVGTPAFMAPEAINQEIDEEEEEGRDGRSWCVWDDCDSLVLLYGNYFFIVAILVSNCGPVGLWT